MAPARRHRLGFIGLGNRGRAHVRTFRRWFDARAEPVAGADAGATHLSEQGQGPAGWPEAIPEDRRFSDYRHLLALEEVEAVVIATYEASHLEIACAALDAGKAVLLEKAAVVSFAEAEALYARLQRRPARFQLALNLRHHEVIRTLRRLVREGGIGRVVSVTAHVNAGSGWGASVARRFYRHVRLSGDLTLSKLTHDSDVLHHILGTHAETVAGVAARTTFLGPHAGEGQDTDHGADDGTSHDTAAFAGQFASGATYSLVFTTAGPVYQRRYHFNGTEGELVATIGGREGDTVVHHRLDGPAVDVPLASAAGGHGGADPRLLGSFLDYLDAGSEAPVEPESVLTSVMVPLGGLQAAREGRTVPVGAWYRRVRGAGDPPTT